MIFSGAVRRATAYRGLATVTWVSIALWVVSGISLRHPGALVILIFAGLYVHLRHKYLDKSSVSSRRSRSSSFRAASPFQARRRFTSPPDGLTLRGCYLRAAAPRRGVILFGLEFGSNRWSCVPYCESLVANGFDVFAFEPRNQGDSDHQPGYEPLQWVTDFEVRDFQAALAYLKSRPDADPRGVGFFGISKGGGAGLLAAAGDPYVRCFVTDGVFATYTTMVPYMRKWIRIYSDRYWMQGSCRRGFTAWWATPGCVASAVSEAAAFPTWSAQSPSWRLGRC